MGRKVKKLLFLAVVAALLTVFCVSAYFVITYFVDAKQQADRYDDLAAMVESAQSAAATRPEEQPKQETPQGTEPEVQKEKAILPEYALLHQMNEDLVGWIKIEGTRINYPVMQSPDEPDYYLHRNFDREYNDHGCIYAEEACDVEAPSDNVTIYGHHMNDGSMFAGLESYLDPGYLAEHPYVQFDTLTEHHTYEIFAVFRTTASVGTGFPYHSYVDMADQAEFDEFIALCRENAAYDTGIIPGYGDKIICLSTCEYTRTNGRLVVAAVRIDETIR